MAEEVNSEFPYKIGDKVRQTVWDYLKDVDGCIFEVDYHFKCAHIDFKKRGLSGRTQTYTHWIGFEALVLPPSKHLILWLKK